MEKDINKEYIDIDEAILFVYEQNENLKCALKRNFYSSSIIKKIDGFKKEFLNFLLSDNGSFIQRKLALKTQVNYLSSVLQLYSSKERLLSDEDSEKIRREWEELLICNVFMQNCKNRVKKIESMTNLIDVSPEDKEVVGRKLKKKLLQK